MVWRKRTWGGGNILDSKTGSGGKGRNKKSPINPAKIKITFGALKGIFEIIISGPHD